MKKSILAILLTTLAAAAHAESLDDLLRDLLKSSSGKLIAINSNFVFSAEGNSIQYTAVTANENVISLSNKLCNFNKQWTATGEAIYCIAK